MNTFLLLLRNSRRLGRFVQLATFLTPSQFRLSSTGLLQMVIVTTRSFRIGLLSIQFPFDLFHFYDERKREKIRVRELVSRYLVHCRL